MLMNILEAIVLFGFGFLIGAYFVVSGLKNMVNVELQKREGLSNGQPNNLNIELINDIYYIFDTKKNSFVCQGKTLEDCLKTLLERDISTAMIRFENRLFIVQNGRIIEVLP